MTLQSEFGGQQAGVRLKLKCLQVNKEMRGTLWHSWPWLRHRGLPHSAEVAPSPEVSFTSSRFMCKLLQPPLLSKVTCAVQGTFAQFQSQAQVVVDRRSLLASGLNVSAPDGRLSLLLSVSPPNQTQPSLATTLLAQIRGRFIVNITFLVPYLPLTLNTLSFQIKQSTQEHVLHMS